MGERDAGRGEPLLFDLPLAPAAGEEGSGGEETAAGPAPEPEPETAGGHAPRAAAPESAARPPRDGGGELPLFPGEAPGPVAARGGPRAAGAGRPSPAAPAPPERPRPAPEPAAAGARAVAAPAQGPPPAPFGARLLAALADLGVHALVAAAGWAGAALAGARLGPGELPALAVFLLAFSFLYSVVSLAFWGRTPGMAAAGVVARGDGGRPLTFGQTGLRWLAGVATALLAGLPLLLALTGRSLPDRLSGSRTFRLR